MQCLERCTSRSLSCGTSSRFQAVNFPLGSHHLVGGPCTRKWKTNQPPDKRKRFTKGVESLMENSSNDKATRGSQVDDLPVAVPDSPNLGIAEARRDDSVPHVCENQVGLTEAALHLTEEK